MAASRIATRDSPASHPHAAAHTCVGIRLCISRPDELVPVARSQRQIPPGMIRSLATQCGAPGQICMGLGSPLASPRAASAPALRLAQVAAVEDEMRALLHAMDRHKKASAAKIQQLGSLCQELTSGLT